MKKLIFTIAFIATGLVATAQVGIGNVDPKVTLHVTGANDNGVVTGVDGVLVPRVNDADMSTATAGTQDGQMVYNIVAKAFYFWNAGTSAWTAVGAAPAFTGRVEQTSSAAYDWTNGGAGLVDFYEFTTDSGNITLPSPVTYAGMTIYVRNNTGGTIGFGTDDGITSPRSVVTLVGTGAMRIWSDGTYWHNVAGR